jgi:hypothetical protein
LLAIVYLVHVVSVWDALRQLAFPGFARGVPVFSTALGVGGIGYLPASVIGFTLAWPVSSSETPSGQFLVNRAAYLTASPRSGDWVMFRCADGRGHNVGRIIAAPHQEVEWLNGHVHVDGGELGWHTRLGQSQGLLLNLTVPDGFWLVDPWMSRRERNTPAGLLLVPASRVEGRSWAQVAPVRQRRFLY